MKLSKVATKNHEAALELVRSDCRLTYEDRIFILENYHEGATHLNAKAGAFFTPLQLARDVALNVGSGGRVIDLCAGIGMLAFAVDWAGQETEIVCVEANAEYVEVGKRVMPNATWIHADVLAYEPDGRGRFRCAVSNPPFGHIGATNHKRDGYTGPEMEFRVIDIASRCAQRGVFVLPQGSCPFAYSGRRTLEMQYSAKFNKFAAETGLSMELGCAVDTEDYRSQWKGTSPLCEVVLLDFPRTGSYTRPALEPAQLELMPA